MGRQPKASAYLRNSWYVAGWSRDLADRPLACRILDLPVVVFRMEDGGVAALADRCPHRHLPLSMGRPVGNFLQCGYHGLTFDRTGACVRAPSQDLIPRKAVVGAYPCVERHGWIWVWMGTPSRADEALIPDFHRLNDPGHAAVGKTNHVRCAYRLVTDNLMDLSHVGFVHTSTIGNAAFGEKGQIVKVTKTERGVKVLRLVPDVPPPPTYVKSGRLPPGRNIDRWQAIEFIAPSFVLIHVGGAEAGTGALEGRYEHGLNIWVLNAITPETPVTTQYHWAQVRNHAIHDEKLSELFFTQTAEAFEEDRRILEAQQEVLHEIEDDWPVALRADAGSVEARRFLDRMIRREAGQFADG